MKDSNAGRGNSRGREGQSSGFARRSGRFVATVMLTGCLLVAVSDPMMAVVIFTDEMGSSANWSGTWYSSTTMGSPDAPSYGGTSAGNLVRRSITYKSAAGNGNGQTYKAKLSCNMYTTTAVSTSSHRYRLFGENTGALTICGATHTSGNAPYFQYYNGAFANGAALAAGWHAMAITVDLSKTSNKIIYDIPGGTYYYNYTSGLTLPDTVGVGTSASSQDVPYFDHVVVEQWYRPLITIGAPGVTYAKYGDVVNFVVTYANYAAISLAAGNVTVNQSGVSDSSVGTVTGSGATRTVPVTAGTGDGTVTISLAASTATSDDGASSAAVAVGPSTAFTVDNTAPTAISAFGSSAPGSSDTDWYNSTGNLTWTWTAATDSSSGLDGYAIVQDQTSSTQPGTTKTHEETATSYTLTGPKDTGEYWLHVRSKDNAGNWLAAGSTSHRRIRIDRTAPSASMDFGTIATDSIQVTGSATDGHSGVNAASYIYSRTGASDSGATGTSYTWTGLAPNTEYTGLKVSVSDNAVPTPNTGASSPQSRWTLSVAPGAGSVTPSLANPCANETLDWTATGGFGAGKVQKYKYVFTQNASHSWDGTEAEWASGTLPTTPTTPGTWYLHVRGYNGASVANGEYRYEVTAAPPSVGGTATAAR